MRKVVSAALVLCGGLLGASLAGVGQESAKQPLEFNHRLHTQDLGMECTECHRYVKTSEFAGRPEGTYCRECHEEPVTESPEEKKLVEFISSGSDIRWKRIYSVPDHVYFSHRRHVSVAEVECEVCHGGMALESSPPQAPLVRLTMEFCMDCHEEQNASVDCNVCHR